MRAHAYETDRPPSVATRGDTVVVHHGQESTVLPLSPLAGPHIEWFAEGRRAAYRAIVGGGGPIRAFAQHLPMVVTWRPGGLFPCNCGNKGVGFLPRDQHLGHHIEAFERVMRDTRDTPWEASLKERIRTVGRFYFDHEAVDYRLLTGLEIFKKRTYANLERNPFASLLFTGEGPTYLSFQLNCAVEVIEEGDPRHRFVMLARTMFEHDDFHITQQRFPYAYLFWITELLDKTPFQVEPPPGEVPEPVVTETGGVWRQEALDMVSRAPGMVQDFIRSSVEAFAAARGIEEITPQLVARARDAYLERKSGMGR